MTTAPEDYWAVARDPAVREHVAGIPPSGSDELRAAVILAGEDTADGRGWLYIRRILVALGMATQEQADEDDDDDEEYARAWRDVDDVLHGLMRYGSYCTWDHYSYRMTDKWHQMAADIEGLAMHVGGTVDGC